jgi:hypothetical protein
VISEQTELLCKEGKEVWLLAHLPMLDLVSAEAAEAGITAGAEGSWEGRFVALKASSHPPVAAVAEAAPVTLTLTISPAGLQA